MKDEHWDYLKNLGWFGEKNPTSKVELMMPLGEGGAECPVKITALNFLLSAPLQTILEDNEEKRLEVIQALWGENQDNGLFRRLHRLPKLTQESLYLKSYKITSFFLRVSRESKLLVTDRIDPWEVVWRTGSIAIVKELEKDLSDSEKSQIFNPSSEAPLWKMLRAICLSQNEDLSFQEVIAFFMDYGFDIKKECGLGGSSIFHNLSFGKAKTLLRALDFVYAIYPNIDKPNDTGVTPLMMVASNTSQSSHMEILKWFLSHGANPNHQDNQGKTPLMHLATHTREMGFNGLSMAKILFQAGADLSLKDAENQTIWEIASSHPDLLELLQEEQALRDKKTLDASIPIIGKNNEKRKL